MKPVKNYCNPNTDHNTEDEQVEIEIDLTDEAFLRLAKRAHEQNITFNELVNRILKEKVEREEKNGTD